MKKTNSNKTAKNSFDFEKGIARIEEIIDLFHAGGLTLDQMEQYFSEGMELIDSCSNRLDQVETRIQTLIKAQENEVSEKEFEDDE